MLNGFYLPSNHFPRSLKIGRHTPIIYIVKFYIDVSVIERHWDIMHAAGLALVAYGLAAGINNRAVRFSCYKSSSIKSSPVWGNDDEIHSAKCISNVVCKILAIDFSGLCGLTHWGCTLSVSLQIWKIFRKMIDDTKAKWDEDDETNKGINYFLREWSQRSSCNGLGNISGTNEGLRKFFWILLVLTGVGRFTYSLLWN